MALKLSGYGAVGSVRLYCSVIQYAKSIGYVKNIFNRNCEPINDELATPFEYNPAKSQTYQANTDEPVSEISFNCEFKSIDEGDRNFAQLLKLINYYGVYGHNISTASGSFAKTSIKCYGLSAFDDFEYTAVSETEPQSYQDIVGTNQSMGNGYSIVGVENFMGEDTYFEAIKIALEAKDGESFQGDQFDINAIDAGVYVDLPQNANLNMNINYDYDGIKYKRTTSGRTIPNVQYYRAPDWGKYSRWTHVSNEALDLSNSNDDNWQNKFNMKNVGTNGRRSWDLTWSFLSEEDVMPFVHEGNMFANGMLNAKHDTHPNLHIHGGTPKSIIGTIMTLSLGGKIPMVFQPDKEVRDFIWVCIDKGISIQQVAPKMYTIKLKLTECY